ncbi:hypothetical protein OV203_05885 [Nannocystis sp. ILAH1]|uniref:hypothetical protein n=1 Tax=unclassified Nannocystis TaxID=2627009 RepID=UPI00226FFD4F|nr:MULTISPECIES: hypothetical protein [unclassified Nannocystis]MCY0986640.1 hypothetical protein [Nannocystis sp. ILAH1]MCY1071521.1 hypothetical protein [Nannocystis sp. RBIL2]
MLKISATQRGAFERAALADFDARMLTHLERFSPRHLRIVGDPELGALIVVGHERAELYGLVSERSKRIYIELMLMFGSGFATDPQHVWAVEPLRAGDDEYRRVDRLRDAAWRHLDRTASDDLDAAGRSQPGRAAAQLQQFAQFERAPSDEAGLDLRALLVALLRRVFPAKCEDIGEPALVRTVEQALATARTFALVTERGQALFVGLAVIFGADFHRDPQFTWAGRALAEVGSANERTRIEALLRGATGCLDRFWAEEG